MMRTVAVVALLVVPVTAAADKVVGVEVSASSAVAGKGDRFAAWRAVDGETTTAWCEGKADGGLGETITLTLSEPLQVTRLDLYVGLHGSAKEYSDNNRPSKISARTAPKVGEPMVMLAKGASITSKHDMLVKLDLKTPRTIQVLEIGLADIALGDQKKANQTCIADISLVAGKDVISFVYGLPHDAMGQLAPAVNVLGTALANCDAKALAWMVKYPFEQHVLAGESSRTVKHKSAKALAAACAKIPALGAMPDDPELEPAGPGRVRIEMGGDVLTMDMVWDGSWKLARIEGH